MNIFKRIGIILSCSIIAFLGVFGVVASTSNINNQVRDLPVVERHNLVGSDVVLTEENYNQYYLTSTNFDLGTLGFEGTFNISGNLILTDSYNNYSEISVNELIVDRVTIMTGGFAFGDITSESYIFASEEVVSNELSLNITTYLKFNNLNVISKYDSATDSLVSSNNSEFLDFINSVCSIYELPPVVDEFLPSITTIVSDVITWFVNIFTGLSDTFVLTDTSGTITGLSAWGQLLFIGVAILLITMSLKWLISLIRGI